MDGTTVKFMLSKKATEIDKIFTVDLTLTTKCQLTVKISSIFVAFLENMNFDILDKLKQIFFIFVH